MTLDLSILWKWNQLFVVEDDVDHGVYHSNCLKKKYIYLLYFVAFIFIPKDKLKLQKQLLSALEQLKDVRQVLEIQFFYVSQSSLEFSHPSFAIQMFNTTPDLI